MEKPDLRLAPGAHLMPLPFTGAELREVVRDLFHFPKQEPPILVVQMTIGPARKKPVPTAPAPRGAIKEPDDGLGHDHG